MALHRQILCRTRMKAAKATHPGVRFREWAGDENLVHGRLREGARLPVLEQERDGVGRGRFEAALDPPVLRRGCVLVQPHRRSFVLVGTACTRDQSAFFVTFLPRTLYPEPLIGGRAFDLFVRPRVIPEVPAGYAGRPRVGARIQQRLDHGGSEVSRAALCRAVSPLSVSLVRTPPGAETGPHLLHRGGDSKNFAVFQSLQLSSAAAADSGKPATSSRHASPAAVAFLRRLPWFLFPMRFLIATPS